MSDKEQQQPGAEDTDTPPMKTFTFRRSITFGRPLPEDGEVAPLDAKEQRWEWHWPPQQEAQPAREHDSLDEPPATYYEALTGRRDPQRDFFIKARRILNWIAWGIALGLPAGIVLLAIVTGQSFETIVFMGIGAFVVGMMFRYSLPRTPFD